MEIEIVTNPDSDGNKEIWKNRNKNCDKSWFWWKYRNMEIRIVTNPDSSGNIEIWENFFFDKSWNMEK